MHDDDDTQARGMFSISLVCATLFPGTSDTEAAATYAGFFKRKRADMTHYASAAKNTLAFSASRAANKSNTAN
jgi:hypothetical protein